MKLKTGVELVTLKDIAQCIAFEQTVSNIERTMRQVRHWTQNDLLRTEGEKTTGKGIPRFYAEEPTMMIAAILKELTLYGSSVELLRPVSDGLYSHYDDDSGTYLMSALTDINAYLQVIWSIDLKSGKFNDASIHFFDDMDRDAGEKLLDEHPSSSVVINMSTVAGRIYSNKSINDDAGNQQ